MIGGIFQFVGKPKTKVSVKPFQRLAGSRGSAPCRAPQSPKPLFLSISRKIILLDEAAPEGAAQTNISFSLCLESARLL
jgi:hypothetical protein